MADEAKVTDYGKWLAAQYGLRVTNQRRSAQHNREVGGAPRSDHLTGMALDMAGDAEQMSSLATWARANTGPGKMFRYVEYGTDDHQDHVHLSFNADAPIPTTNPGGDVAESTVTAAAAPKGPAAPLPENATVEQIDAWLHANRPDVVGFLGNDELKMIAYYAATHDLSDEQYDAMIKGSQYYQTHSAPSRAVDEFLNSSGDAEIARITDEAKRHVASLASRQGVTLDDANLSKLAMQALRAGDISLQGYVLDETGLNQMLAISSGVEGKSLGGEASLTADTLGATARQYFVPVTRQGLEDWTRKIIAGTATEDSFRSWLAGQARAAFRNDEDVLRSIEEGRSPAEHFQSHRAAIAQAWEVDESEVDLMDPRFRDILQYRDPETGEVRSRSWVEAEQWAKGGDDDDGNNWRAERFRQTRQYQQQSAEVSTNLARWMGRAA